MQWEEITRGIEKNAKTYIKSCINKEGEFSTDEVNVVWKILPREYSYIAFEKLRFAYTLDWIMIIKITRITPFPDRPITPDVIDIVSTQKIIPEYEPNNVIMKTDQQKSRYKASTIETAKEKKPPEYSPRPVSSEFKLKKTYTPSKIETEGEPVLSGIATNRKQKMLDLFGSNSEDENRETRIDTVQVSSDDWPKEERRTAKKRLLSSVEPKTENSHQKKQKKTKEDPSQSNLESWIGKKATPSKVTERKPSRSRAASKMRNGTYPMDAIDESAMGQMQSFLEKTKQDEIEKVRRRDELEDFDVWDCNDVEREELKR
jgi:hypothetical protein